MENAGRLDENFDALSAAMDVLRHLRDEVARIRERQSDTWLQNVEAKELQVDEMQKELIELHGGGCYPNNLKARFKLNKKVIESLKAVKDLKREGDCIVVARITGAASISQWTVIDDSSEAIEKIFREMAREKLLRLSPTQLRSFTSNFSSLVGSGAFGEVYKGQFPNGLQVAVKVLKAGVSRDAIEKQFMAEVTTIGRTYHRNLVRLYGFCFDTNMKALVFEYMENGSLDKLLYENHLSVDWGKLHEIAIGTAKAISYLHESCHKRIIHYDIKAGNVLLDSNLSPKVADFGLAKLCNNDSSHVTMTGFRGTPGYAAPEVWMPFPVTYKCDIYSFGMLLFEVLGRRRNWNNRQGDGQTWFPLLVWQKFEKGQLDEIIEECGIEERDREKAKNLCMVALWCAQYMPQVRPSMSTVVKTLEREIQPKVPPNPFPHMVSLGVYSMVFLGTNNITPSLVSSSASITSDDSTKTTGPNYNVELPSSRDFSDFSSSSFERQAELQSQFIDSSVDVDLLPAISDLQISGEACPGQEIQVCGYCINGTTSCNFQWVRYLEDGSANYIEGATTPNYLVTADDVDALLGAEVQPIDDLGRKGEIVKVFANEQRKITCDPEMLKHIEEILYSGHASFKVSVAVYLDIWEPAILTYEREGYSIKSSGALNVVFTEKFLQKTAVTIPYGQPTAFSVSGSADYRLRTESSSLRDTIVLAMRFFILRGIKKENPRRRRISFFPLNQ